MRTITYPYKNLHTHEAIRQPNWLRIILLSVLGYEGAGAMVGGALLVLEPDGRLMDMPVDIMHGTFSDFLIPGIILFGLGILNSFAFISVLTRNRKAWIMADIALGGMLIWFWVEIAILQALHWLHAMWGLPVVIGALAAVSLLPSRTEMLRKAAVFSGILSTILYIIVNILVPMQWPEYNSASQTVSELSAIGAPTRILWNVLCAPYTLLILAFAWGVWRTAEGNIRLRIAGVLLMIYGATGLLWPFAPMHLRETLAAGGGTFSDTMHLTLGAITQVIYLLALGFTASALGRGFRLYSIATFLVLLVFGLLTFIDSPAVPKNEPTPFIGIWERVNIGVFLLWVVVLALTLLPVKNEVTVNPHITFE